MIFTCYNKLFRKLSSLFVIQLLVMGLTERNPFSLNIETSSNIELFYNGQHPNFLIIDSSSEYDIENPALNLVTLGQTFQTWNGAEKFLIDYALVFGEKELKIKQMIIIPYKKLVGNVIVQVTINQKKY
jgi:hypothetical protein